MCATWRSQALTRGLALKPDLVVPVGIDLPAPYSSPTQGLKTSIQALVSRIGSARTVFIDPPPHFASFAAMAGCVSTRPTTLNVCEVRTKWLETNQIFVVQRLLSQQLRIPVIPTRSLFCGVEYCPIFVKLQGKSWLVYGDGYHVALSYSQLLGKSLPMMNLLS